MKGFKYQIKKKIKYKRNEDIEFSPVCFNSANKNSNQF